MTLEQLRIFVCVAERLNMTRAAEVLHITQSGVSASISALENTYGTALFDRIGRRIELSAAGQAFLGEAEKILHQVGSAQRALSDLSNLRRGVVSICASQTVGNYYLPHVLADFQHTWPHLDIDFHIGTTASVVRMILDGKAELGFIEGDHNEPALTNLEVDGDRLCIFVRPDHAWARGPVEPRALLSGGWVLREEGSGTRSDFVRALEAMGLPVDQLEVRLKLPTNEAVRSAVLAGAGPGALSDLVVKDAIASGALVKVGFVLPRRPFRILRHSDRKLSRAAEVFIKSLPSSSRSSPRAPAPEGHRPPFALAALPGA